MSPRGPGVQTALGRAAPGTENSGSGPGPALPAGWAGPGVRASEDSVWARRDRGFQTSGEDASLVQDEAGQGGPRSGLAAGPGCVCPGIRGQPWVGALVLELLDWHQSPSSQTFRRGGNLSTSLRTAGLGTSASVPV